ncbi:MAG TPA: D-2-hydroxyacid dehydrogenase family protein [Vicinamibacterales bacterium]
MTRLRCAILDDYQRVALSMADWGSLADRVDVVPFHERLTTEDAVVHAIGDCQIVVAMRERSPFRRTLLSRLPQLRLLVSTGTRNAAIDVAAAHELGITVCHTSSRPEPPAELTWALILALVRHIVPEPAALASGGPWQQTLGVDLRGRRLGLLGLGKIGQRVARVGLAFDMDVAAWSQNLTAERAAEVGVHRAASKEDLLESSDIVSIHLVLSPRTRGLLGRDDLRRMCRTAYLVNTSRGPIVDEAALVEALREGWIAGAGLDVFDEEPVPLDSPFRGMPNVLGTPHLGYVSEAGYRTYYGEAVEDIRAFLDGAPVRVLS